MYITSGTIRIKNTHTHTNEGIRL